MRADCVLRHGTSADLPRIAALWRALYDHQQAHGMRLQVPPAAFEAWEQSMAPGLGRFTCLALAERDQGIVGFVAGRVRTLPGYFGGGPAGFISEVYVDESARGAGIGRRVLAYALEWFASQGIARVELQVVSGNPDAIRFYRELGWHEELLQMVWDTKSR